MKEATTAVTAEQPKKPTIKEGTKPAGSVTAVDGAAGEAKAPRVITKTNSRYRILAGVDASKFRGQRNIVVKALQGLQGEGTGAFTLEQIAAKCDGLQSRTPVEASAKYHLTAMVKNGEVELIPEVPAPVPATTDAPATDAPAAILAGGDPATQAVA